MSNALTTVPAQLPAYLQKYRDQTQGINDGAFGGIKATSRPRINIGASKFSIVRDGEKVLITDPSNPQLPKIQLEVVVVGHNPAGNKIFYDGAWQEGDADEPDCSSDDGVRPDAHIASPQSSACATCPKIQWGSKISEQGKQIKACSDNKRLVVLPIHDLNSEPLEFTIKPSSLKEWANYVRGLSSRGIDVTTCVTNVFFDPAANYPKLLFRFGRFLTEEELRLYKYERTLGRADIRFLEHSFRGLMLNFNWWVNRKDPSGRNVFAGGFLGLDNIGVFDRSAQLPTGGSLEQADGTAWMAFYCQCMLEMAMLLSDYDAMYEEIACKFLQHFMWISYAMDRLGEHHDEMWDEQDGFFYDLLRLPDGSATRLKVRSMVGLLPLCAVTVFEASAKLEKDQNNPHHIVTRSGVGYIMPILREGQNN